MQIVIVGAGSIGSAIAGELVSRDEVLAVRVVDTHVRALQELADRESSPKLQSYQLDARDPVAMAPVLEEAACVISAGSAVLGGSLASLALQHGSHYCDLGGTESVVTSELDLDNAARSADRWVLPGVGLAPGLVNMLCLHGIEQFDRVDSATIRVGDLPVEPEEPFLFQLGSTPEKLLNDYTGEARVLRNGTLETVDPLSGIEPIGFGAGFEHLEAFHTAGSLSLLADRLQGRVTTLDHKTVQWPGHADRMRFLLALGLGEDRSLDVRTHLSYRDILIRRMRQRLTGDRPDVVLMRVTVQGVQDGRQRMLTYEMEERGEPHGLSAMKRCTAIPASCVAWMLASGEVPGSGAAPPETAVPLDALLRELRERGLQISQQWQDAAL